MWDTNTRLRRIERLLGILTDPTEEDLMNRDASIRMEVAIIPKWDEILRTVIPSAADLEKFFEQHPNFLKDRQEWTGTSSEEPLWREHHFTYFHDALSGLEIIWYREAKALGTKMSIHDSDIEIAPWGIRYDEPFSDRMREVGEIPFWDIVRLLTDIGKRADGCERYAIKRFSDRVRDELEKAGVTYDPLCIDGDEAKEEHEQFNKTKWAQANGVRLYDKKVDSHWFKTKYCTIVIDLDVIDKRKARSQEAMI